MGGPDEHAGGGPPQRDDLLRLPPAARTRLRDIPRHLRALQSILATTDEDRYSAAARSSDPSVLTRDVYPLERAFEILIGYIVELAQIGVEALEIEPRDAVRSLRTLVDRGAVTRARAERLVAVYRARNALVHQYPDVRARLVYEAADALDTETAPFVRDYTPWLIATLDAERT
jgi:uncharacterized protein YutE (UPF0331/DUF86 family)